MCLSLDLVVGVLLPHKFLGFNLSIYSCKKRRNPIKWGCRSRITGAVSYISKKEPGKVKETNIKMFAIKWEKLNTRVGWSHSYLSRVDIHIGRVYSGTVYVGLSILSRTFMWKNGLCAILYFLSLTVFLVHIRSFHFES